MAAALALGASVRKSVKVRLLSDGPIPLKGMMVWTKTGYKEIFKNQGIKVLHRRLLISGYTQEDAGNLIAGLMGLGTNEKGWTVYELAHLLYQRELHKLDHPKVASGE